MNSEDDKINNLDLDGDGNIDYIKIIDSVVKELHNVLLQVDLGHCEAQKVAVLLVKKEKDGATIHVRSNEILIN